MSPARLEALLWSIAARDPATHPLLPSERRVLRRLARRARLIRGHLLFSGWVDRDGYPQLSVARRQWKLHRWLYETFVDAATGMDVDHECGMRACGLHLRKLEPWKNRGWQEPV